MTGRPHLLLLPGLLCDETLWKHQAEAFSDVADITIADMTLDDTMEAMARRALDSMPGKFALAGLSMGGYAAFEIMRQASDKAGKGTLIRTD